MLLYELTDLVDDYNRTHFIVANNITTMSQHSTVPLYSHKRNVNEVGMHIPGTTEVLENDERVAFWRPDGWPCQWSYVEFEIDGIQFTCTEQAMMYLKAMLFNDHPVAHSILSADHPKKYKSLGRKVKNFDESKWESNKFDIVERVNYAKFDQNPLFKQALLNTGNRLLIEASPLDSIWGIGVDPKTALSLLESQFKGQNLLGKALMKVRESLK